MCYQQGCVYYGPLGHVVSILTVHIHVTCKHIRVCLINAYHVRSPRTGQGLTNASAIHPVSLVYTLVVRSRPVHTRRDHVF